MTEHERLLHIYNSIYENLFTLRQESAWRDLIDIDGNHGSSVASLGAALSAFQGDMQIVKSSLRALSSCGLSESQERQFRKIIRSAAEAPRQSPELVSELIVREAEQIALFNRYNYTLDGQKVTAAHLQGLLANASDRQLRLKAWQALASVGQVLLPGNARVRDLRNIMAGEFGFDSYLDLQAAEYDMTAEQLKVLLGSFVNGTRELFDRLYIFTKSVVEKRYNTAMGENMPIHLFPDQWGQSWTGMIPTSNELDQKLGQQTAKWIIETADEFWKSLGFSPLPDTFWERSSLFPTEQRKFAGASMWHVDLRRDIRGLMNIVPNAYWFGAAHHELGHAHYYLTYGAASIPAILRRGAFPAFHEAVGDLIRLAAFQPRYLSQLGLGLPEGIRAEARLIEALELSVPLVAFSAGTMFHFEYDIYRGRLPANSWQESWWRHASGFQRIITEDDRSDNACDGLSKRHLTMSPGYYHNYAIATIVKYQLYEHICNNVVYQDPNDSNFFGERRVGEFLHSLMMSAGTRPWREAYEEAVGEPLSVEPLLRRFRNLNYG